LKIIQRITSIRSLELIDNKNVSFLFHGWYLTKWICHLTLEDHTYLSHKIKIRLKNQSVENGKVIINASDKLYMFNESFTGKSQIISDLIILTRKDVWIAPEVKGVKYKRDC